MAFSSDNLPPPKVIENGVVVPPRLQIGEMSISQWHSRTTWDAAFAGMTQDQLLAIARQMGFSEEEIAKEFRL